MMLIPEWCPDYATGHAEIDAQHQRLFSIASQLARKIETGSTHADRQVILTELLTYAHEHFAFEEAVMDEMGFEHLAYHRKMHEYMKARLDLFASRVQKSFLSEDELAEFVETWLTEHIIMEDLRLVPAIARARRK